jgi:mono/diheme cytochrome c family protein
MAVLSNTSAVAARRHQVTRLVLGTVVFCGAWALAGQRTHAQRVQAPTLLSESVDGGDAFARFCGSCHGRGGEGDGPVARTLRYKPTDLTQLARRNDGVFPIDRVRALLVGYANPLKAHGESDMPVWGVIFRALDASDTRAAIRGENLVTYVEQLQEPPRASDGLGARLFMTHCASCHGRDARGDGIVAPVDLSPPSPHQTDVAARIAAALSVPLVLAHVLEPIFVPYNVRVAVRRRGRRPARAGAGTDRRHSQCASLGRQT